MLWLITFKKTTTAIILAINNNSNNNNNDKDIMTSWITFWIIFKNADYNHAACSRVMHAIDHNQLISRLLLFTTVPTIKKASIVRKTMLTDIK